MTALGKILVFFNLLFSLVAGGLIVVVFLTRTNWKQGYDDLGAQVNVMKASMDAERAKFREQLQVRDQAMERLKGELNTTNQRLTDAINETKATEAKLAAANAQLNRESTNNQAVTQDMDRMKQERAQYQNRISERENTIANLEKQAVVLRNQATEAKLSLDTALARVEKLMIQVESLLRENADLKQRGAAPVAANAGERGGRPTQVEVRSTVTVVSNSLAQIGHGSDAGVVVGAELEVYRLAPTPTYMGKLVITSVRPHEAVGRFEPVRRNETIRIGDEVASRVLGNR